MTAEHHSQLPPGHQSPPTVPLEGQGTLSGHTVEPATASSLLSTHAFCKRPLDDAESEPKLKKSRQHASDKDAAYFTAVLCYWPGTLGELRERLQQPCSVRIPAPALCHTLTRTDIRAGTWRGVRQSIYNRVDAADFLASWCRTSGYAAANLTASTVFPWGRYVLGIAKREEVVGNEGGIIKFYIAEVPGVADPCNPDDNLIVFIACRADGSQVRIQPHRDQPALVLYLDRLGPAYRGHLARTTPWPPWPQSWGPPPYEGECRLCPRYGPEPCSWASLGVIATADGLMNLHDIVTTLEAQSARLSLELCTGQELDLCSGERFPWALWVHHQPEVMQIIGDSNGVTYFGAVDFSFMREGSLVKAQAFQIDMEEGTSLALIPVDRVLTIAPMTKKSNPFTSECQWLLDRLAT